MCIAEQTDLGAGLKLERGFYYTSFSLEDRTEGMKAFVEKREPAIMDRQKLDAIFPFTKLPFWVLERKAQYVFEWSCLLFYAAPPLA